MSRPPWWQQMFWERRSSWLPEAPPDLVLTAPPRESATGLFECTGCDAVVAWGDLTIDEAGYFCPGCVRAR